MSKVKASALCWGLLVGILILLQSFNSTMAANPEILPSDTLTRDQEPVVVAGNQVSLLTGTNVNDLFVYAYTAGTWRQIPFQIDEKTVAGAYTLSEDGLLDNNDEIVFMAKDLGDQSPANAWVSDEDSANYPRYEINVVDGTAPGNQAWAYIYRSATLRRVFTEDYVIYDSAHSMIVAAGYTVGLMTAHPGMDYLTLHESQTDILDRTKMRVAIAVPIIGQQTVTITLTEDSLDPLVTTFLKDGPVRVILKSDIAYAGIHLGYMENQAYRSLLQTRTSFNVEGIIPSSATLSSVRLSTDLNADVSGAIYFDGNTGGGVTVNGVPDSVTAQPFSRWRQVNAATGTVIEVTNVSAAGGIPTNYYEDDATLDPTDTGDGKCYGDAGFSIAAPAKVFAVPMSIFVLPVNQPNVGATYERYFDDLLRVSTQASAAPKAVADLRASNSASKLRLVWSAVTQDTQGSPITGVTYNVYRAADQPYFTPGMAYATGLTSPTYTDPDPNVIGNTAHSFYYVVKAVDALGRVSAASNRVGAFTFTLIPGH